jgi:hypothetical protein
VGEQYRSLSSTLHVYWHTDNIYIEFITKIVSVF